MAIGVTQKWYAAAAGASVAVLAAGYFILVSPQQTNASEITTQAESVTTANAHAEAQIAALKVQYADLPLLQSQVAAIRARLPQTTDEPALLRSLSALAKTSGVSLVSVTATAPTPMGTPALSVTGVSALSAPGQVSQLPLSIEVVGSFANTRLFLNGLESLQRSMLVSGIDVSRDAVTAGVNNLRTLVSAKVFMANPGSVSVAGASTTSTGTGSTNNQPS